MKIKAGFRAGALALAFALGACGGDGAIPAPTPSPTPTPTPAPLTQQISFNANGSAGTPPAPLSAAVGSSVTIPTADLTVPGYTFAGWNTQADGSGTAYAAGTSTMPGTDTILYAQFKAPPIKITQQGGDAQSRLLIEWPDGSKQDIVYTADIVGWGNSYDFNPVVGGMAILVPGGTRYMHTSYPSDYQLGAQPVMTITSGSTKLLTATTFRLSDREGPLAAGGSSVTADEIKVTVKGRLLDSEADTEVELIVRADAPRMALTRSKITYTRATTVSRLYHQLTHANPNRINDPITYLSFKDGGMIEVPALPTDLSAGIFYTSQPSYYVGFVGPRAGAQDFLAYRDGPYFAAYKIMYDNLNKVQGDFTETRGVAAWGFNIADARRLLTWSADYTRGAPPVATSLPYGDRGALRMVGESYKTN